MDGLACSFTGHRKISSSHIAALPELLARAINYAYEQGVRRFYNGGAYGFDLISARAVLLFRTSHPDVSLNMILPCRNQDARWSDRDKEAYAYVLSSADSVTYLADHYYNGCMQRRNAKLVEYADMLISYVERNSGGSYQTQRMAKKKGIKTYNLYPTLARSVGTEGDAQKAGEQ